MGIPVPRKPCYLVEWYEPELTDEELDVTVAKFECAAATSADDSAVHLLMALAVPTDDVVFGLFRASSEQVVVQACNRAGMPAQRVTVATHLAVTPDSVTPD